MSMTGVKAFRQTMLAIDPSLMVPKKIETLQINVGNLCNQTCVHCHVTASPNGRNNMEQDTFDNIIAFIMRHKIDCLDITGGAPEMNPNFQTFVDQAQPYMNRVMVRTNLTVFFEPGMIDLPEWYAQRKITLVASLPCYTEKTVDEQRGKGVFDKSIEALRQLNQRGYGCDLNLYLVYNPSGDFLPSPQNILEDHYRKELRDRYDIEFTGLFALANLPVGRFKHFLRKEGRLESYTQLLADHFNTKVAEAVMCRSLINVDWHGTLYHCDFNQQEKQPIRDSNGRVMTVNNLDEVIRSKYEIVTGSYCYGCTAGYGSSCTGATL